MGLFTQDELISAIQHTTGKFAILVGCPVSNYETRGVPNVNEMLTIIDDYVGNRIPHRLPLYRDQVRSKKGQMPIRLPSSGFKAISIKMQLTPL